YDHSTSVKYSKKYIVPAWLNLAEYPFKSHYLDVEGHQMHYIDEGEGQPILFLHDLPLWSFQYRQVIKGLMDQYRCVALDYMGFGLSDKPKNAVYSLTLARAQVKALMIHLKIEQAIVVAHGWSVQIAQCLDHWNHTPTYLFLPPSEDAHPFARGKKFQAHMAVMNPGLLRGLVKDLFEDKQKAKPWLLDQYILPFKLKQDRAALKIFLKRGRDMPITMFGDAEGAVPTPYMMSEENPEALIERILALMPKENVEV
ncbi:MAG: alpha/beta fold hydrolase, partial [Bacteroidota bacterium]